jgi:exonuclease SbcD
MLRILHTADWHLGQSFHGYDRDYEHARFLEWLLQTMAERRPDALLIAGDIFDSVNPPATAQRRVYDFLAQAHASPAGVAGGDHCRQSRRGSAAGSARRDF